MERERATRLDVDGLYPVGSLLSTRYEHAEGVVLTLDQCKKIGIEIENACISSLY